MTKTKITETRLKIMTYLSDEELNQLFFDVDCEIKSRAIERGEFGPPKKHCEQSTLDGNKY